jgi:hypothetical protein
MVDTQAASDTPQYVRLLVMEALGNQHRDRFADRFVRSIAEQSLCPGVPTGNYTVKILGDYRVFGRFDDGRHQSVRWQG